MSRRTLGTSGVIPSPSKGHGVRLTNRQRRVVAPERAFVRIRLCEAGARHQSSKLPQVNHVSLSCLRPARARRRARLALHLRQLPEYDGAPLLRKSDIRTDEHSLWRYDAALPIRQSDAVAYFGEGMTPLVPSLRERRTVPVQARLPDAERLLQGSGLGGAGERPAHARRTRGCRGLVRERGRLAGLLRRPGRPRLRGLHTGQHVGRQARPDQRAWSRAGPVPGLARRHCHRRP